jgi:hypothetical protein
MINMKRIETEKYLRGIWCLLGIWILWQCGSVMMRSAFLPGRIQRSLVQYKKSIEKPEQGQSSPAQNAQAPKNMFASQKVEIPKCMAVLGNEALINGRWYKAGDSVDGATIEIINPESVKILWEGKEQTLVPFDQQVQYAKSGASPSSGGGKAANNKSEAPSGTGQPGSGGSGMGGASGGPRGSSRPSPDEQRRMYERYQNASPEEQERMRQEMRERFGGRGRGRRGGRPDRSRER